MANLHKLVVSLYANVSEFAKGLGIAKRQWKTFERAAKDTTKNVAIGISATTAALTALSIRQAHVIDEQAKLARSLGVSLKGFQSLTLVANEAGVSQDGLVMALRKTQQAIFEAASGGKKAGIEFKALGLNIEQLTKLSPDKQFESIAIALDKVKDPAEKTALAIKLFGKSGGEIIPLLEDFSAKSADAAAFMEKFGVSVSEIDAGTIENANDKFGRLWKIIEGIGNIIAVKVAPLVSKLSDYIISIAPDAKQTGSAIDKVFKVIGTGIDVVIVSFKSLRIALNEASLAFDRFIYDATRNLIIFINSTNDIPTLAGKFDSLKDSLFGINQEAGKSMVSTNNFIKSLQSDLDNYQSSYDKFLKISEEERKKSKKDVTKKSSMSGLVSGSIANAEKTQKFSDALDALKEENSLLRTNISLAGKADAIKEATLKKFDIERKLAEEGVKLSSDKRAALDEEIKKYEQLTEMLRRVQEEEARRKQLMEDIGNSVSSAFEDAIINGKKLSSTLKSLAKDIVDTILRSQIRGAVMPLFTGGGSGGGLLGGIIGGGLGKVFSSFLPSFDVGSNFVPKDMIANIHKGEMIIPAKEASAIRSGGMSGANIVQNITIGSGVTAAVRQEITKMLPDIKRATIQGVEESKFRGATT